MNPLSDQELSQTVDALVEHLDRLIPGTPTYRIAADALGKFRHEASARFCPQFRTNEVQR